MEVTISNARIVTADSVTLGNLTSHEGQVAAIETNGASTTLGSSSLDWDGDYLIPGLVDIHTDNLEKHFIPRNNSPWDNIGAAVAHDGQVISAGVTTVFDSLSAHGQKGGFHRNEIFSQLIDGLGEANDGGMLKADHLLHIRCEVTNPELRATVEALSEHPKLKLLSVMDHTPGQGQWGDLSNYKTRLKDQGLSDSEVKHHIDEVMGWRDLDAVDGNRDYIFSLGGKLGIPVASHDDRRPEQVVSTKCQGGTIAEFPLTLEAAEQAKKEQMWTVFGAPNFVRGGSHSGNVSVQDVARAGWLDALCSDYIPHSMLRSAFLLTEAPFNWSLSDAINTVTKHPAALAALDDRGEIAPGKRADFVRVRHTEGRWPVVKEVWVAGERVA